MGAEMVIKYIIEIQWYDPLYSERFSYSQNIRVLRKPSSPFMESLVNSPFLKLFLRNKIKVLKDQKKILMGASLKPNKTETMKFCGCRDRDFSRLENSVVVETESHRDWEILWLSRPRLIETGKFCGYRDRDQSKLNKSCRNRDFIESLVNQWFYS